MKLPNFLGLMLWIAIPLQLFAQQPSTDWRVGVSKADITPTQSVRLSGYGNRSKPTLEVDDRLSARALAFQFRDQQVSLIVSIDAIGLSATLTDRISAQITQQFSVARNQLVLCTTHSHTAPHLEDVLTNLLSTPLSEPERLNMMAYSQSLVDSVVRIAGEAIGRMRPATMEFGTGRADFAVNRRLLKENKWTGFGVTTDGPVDRTVRVLRARETNGQTLAIVYQYACHCTSISPDLNRISADWAGLSASKIEQAIRPTSPNCIALPIIGCGADANPNPRNTYQNAMDHASEMATAVQTVCSGTLQPLPPLVSQSFELVALAPERPSRDRLKTMTESNSVVERNFANSMLETLKRKGRLPETYPAPVHVWNFGGSLAWVFLGGEVVVDYQIRLEKELSQFRNVWVAAYTDDVFAYVASERIRNEGGYEVDASMLYYNQPGRWVSGTEDVLVTRILDMARQKRSQDQPLLASEALASIEMPKGWKLEMVASEPTIQDPVNVAFGADGTVWVLEMGDYPLGGPKSGQLKRLIDRDGDGKYESSSVFLDGLSYPAGLYPWRDGIVVASAPEVFLAVDRDKDGVADERRSLIRGFPFANPQHRVHGFTYGLDHRLHFGTGSGVKEIIEVATGNTIQAGGSDLSLDVDTGKVYLETGSTQYIRGCDDWGNWFGNDNSHPLFHYVWDRAWSKYTKSSLRTQFQHVLQPATAPPVFPISREADRFNDLFAANRYTSACSSIFCRSPGATADMQECAMVCEPVHNLVSRIQIRRSGASFAGDRFVQDRQSEWMRSSDPWFRPVRIENAPDGTLWVVDMYRRVIEHPEWIPDDWQRRLNLRAGEDKGRIYRAYRTDYVPLAKKDWTLASISELLVALGSSSSAISDLARQQLIWRGRDNADVAKSIASELRSHSSKTKDAVVRLRCMAVLSSLDQANSADWIQTVRDSDERVARWGVESVAKQRLVQGQIRAALMDLASTEPAKSSTPLALQLIVALITCDEPAYDPFAGLLIRHAGDRWIDTVTSLLPNSGIDTVIERLLANANIRTESTINQLIASASQSLKQRLRDQIISGTSPRPAWHYTLCRQFAILEDKNLQLPDVTADLVVDAAGKAIADESSTIDIRRSALSWYALRCGKEDQRQLNLLVQTLSKSQVSELQTAIIGALVSKGEFAMNLLFSEWPRLSTQTRANVISNCLSSPAHANFLMKQIEDKRISVGDFQPAQMETMRSVQEPGFAAQVVKYFGDPPGADRMAIVRDYHDRWPKAIDAGRGEALYKQHCAQCHQDKADATGTMVPAVGPNLQALAGWKNDAWLSAIFDPNRAVEPKYRRVLILTVDAQTMVGLKLRETETAVDFINEQGQMFSLPRASIDQLRESNKSLMPEGFEKIMTPEDTASVISFLRSNPSTAK